MRQAVRFTLMTILEAEIEAFIGARPYQRTSQRRAYRNGSYQRSLTTSIGQIDDLEVPRTRQGFQTNCLSGINAARRNWTPASARCL